MRTLLSLFIVFIFTCSTLSAQWQQCNGPYGGRITCSIVADTLVYVGTMDNGIYFRPLHSFQWSHFGLSGVSITSLLSYDKKLFVATSQGVYCTNDGKNWLQSGLETLNIHTLIVTDSTLYAGTNRGMYQTTNNGETWTEPTPIFAKSSVKSLLYSNNRIYAGTEDGDLYQSTDNGVSWTLNDKGLPKKTIFTLIADDSILYAGLFGGVYKSTDYGISWTSFGLADKSIFSLLVSDSKLFAGCEGGLYYRNTNDSTWLSAGLEKMDISACINIDSELFITTLSDGVYKSVSQQNNQWISVSDGLEFRSAMIIREHNGALFCGSQEFGGGVWKSTDKGNTWTLLPQTKDPILAMNSHNSSIYISTLNEGVKRSNNNGENWTTLTQGLPETDVLCFTSSSDTLFVGTWNNGIYYSTNNGDMWHQGLLTDKDITEYIITPIHHFTATWNHGIYRSSDYGKTWQSTLSATPNAKVQFMKFANGYIYAGLQPGTMLRSSDNGENWTEITIANSLHILCIEEFEEKIIVGTANGIYYSLDNGITWIYAGLSDMNIKDIRVGNSTLYVGTDNHGIWKLDLSTLSSAEEQIYNNTEFTLTLSPNPNNGILHISLNNENTDIPLSVEIFSMQGEKIIEYTTEQNSFTLDINALPNGMYYLLALKGNRSQRQVLSVVR